MLNFGTNGCRSWILWIVWIFFNEIFENCYLTLTKIKCFCVCKAYMYSIFSLWLSEAHSNIRDPVIFFKFKCIGEKMLQERLIFLQGNFIFCDLNSFHEKSFPWMQYSICKNQFSIFTFFPIIYLEVKCVEVNFPILCYIEKLAERRYFESILRA